MEWNLLRKNTFNLLKFFLLTRWRFKNWNVTQIQKYQQKQLQKLINYSIKHSRFYADFYEGYNSSDFLNLPFMNKLFYMDNFSTLNTKGLTKEECIQYCLAVEQSRDFSQYYKGFLIGMSTGTSGNKGIEFATKLETFLMQYLVYRRFPFPKARKYHLAFILRVFSPGFSHNGVKLRISYVSPLNSIDNIVSQLNQLHPNLLSGPPSILQILAKARVENKLLVNPLIVISYGEVLSPEVKDILSRDFECPIMEVYKSSESLMAISCKHGKLHINEDTTFIEVLDQNMKPVLPGNPGFVVVSDFIKHGTPIIRYQLNDLITVDQEKCSCGSNFRVIKQVHGRADDVIIGQVIDKEEYQLILPDYIRRSIVRSSNLIEEYNTIQNSPTELSIMLQLRSSIPKLTEIKEEIEKSITSNINDIFSQHGCEKPQINYQYGNLTHDLNSKLRRIRRNFESNYFK